MAESKECPMCTEFMRLHQRDTVTLLPGTSESRTTTSSEWICPECDYFEESDEDSD
jgi:hypothetical protein